MRKLYIGSYHQNKSSKFASVGSKIHSDMAPLVIGGYRYPNLVDDPSSSLQLPFTAFSVLLTLNLRQTPPTIEERGTE